MKHASTLMATSAAAVAALVLAASPAMAADYFEEKKITVQVPSGSGGSFHVFCQVVQKNLGKYIPGDPQMLIQNMPGTAARPLPGSAKPGVVQGLRKSFRT